MQKAGCNVIDDIHHVYRVSNLQAAYAKSLHTISLDNIETDSEILASFARKWSERSQKKCKKKEDRYNNSATKTSRCSCCNK